VLKRGADDRGPITQGAPAPVLSRVRPAASPLLPAARLGDDLLVIGSNLRHRGTVTAIFECARLGITQELPLTGLPQANQLGAHLPKHRPGCNRHEQLGHGVYTVSLRIAQPNVPAWTTNGVPLALAPLISVSPLNLSAGTISFDVTCTPRLQPQQTALVRLLFGDSEVQPASITTPANPQLPTTLHFTIPGVAAGSYLVRLRVDGIDSLPVTLSGSPATFEFDPQQKVTVT